MTYQPYPAWRYHATEPAIVVNDEASDQALGAGWFSHPLLDKAPGYEASLYQPAFVEEAKKADFPRNVKPIK